MGIFDKIKQTTSSTIESSVKPQLVKQATNIDYGAVSNSLETIDNLHPIPESIFLSLDLLQKAADNYKLSTAANKDDEFFNFLVNNIDAKLILTTLEPLASIIPGGPLIVMALKLIIKVKN
ncbi:MAG: hypothetical protein LBC68_00600 [Prevotellaceae bacterium]|jgi:hypothetical protein|nr:hypothetical protein [Prevotellaceae bacterium]